MSTAQTTRPPPAEGRTPKALERTATTESLRPLGVSVGVMPMLLIWAVVTNTQAQGAQVPGNGQSGVGVHGV